MQKTLAIALATLIATPALAAGPAALKNDLDKRPVEAISAELGVAPETFIKCFSDVSPAGDFNPSSARQHTNKAILLPCLQTDNASLTNDRLDQVMDKYRGQHINAEEPGSGDREI